MRSVRAVLAGAALKSNRSTPRSAPSRAGVDEPHAEPEPRVAARCRRGRRHRHGGPRRRRRAVRRRDGALCGPVRRRSHDDRTVAGQPRRAVDERRLGVRAGCLGGNRLPRQGFHAAGRVGPRRRHPGRRRTDQTDPEQQRLRRGGVEPQAELRRLPGGQAEQGGSGRRSHEGDGHVGARHEAGGRRTDRAARRCRAAAAARARPHRSRRRSVAGPHAPPWTPGSRPPRRRGRPR